MKLIMLPYAGSIFNAYREWEQFSSPQLEVVSIDYCGRGRNSNIDEPRSWDELVSTTCEFIQEQLVMDERYILFGHSMGAKVAYSVYRRLKLINGNTPIAIIFSGTKSFDVHSKDLSLLTQKEFQNYFIKMGGIDEEVLRDDELREIIFQYLRKDVDLLSEFNFDKERVEVTCPVLILNGKDDEKSTQESWYQVLGRPCFYYVFSGQHFFILKNKRNVYTKLRKVLKSIL